MRTNKCRVVLWGCGFWGQKALNDFADWKVVDCEIVAFGDNDKSKWGKDFNGYPVLSMDEIAKMGNGIDAVVISAAKVEEIEQQLCHELNVPIYRNLSTFIFQRASIDITGWCNAKCKWCATGSLNRLCLHEKKYMNFEMFKKVYRKLRDVGLIFPINEVLLYSWGEPFLNPDYLKIIEFLDSEEQRFSISTNASVLKFASKNEYQYCDTVIFSLSGFSEESYKKIHGFDLEKIKENIKLLIDNMRQHGFAGTAKISFHVYNFNEGEVDDARAFAESLGIVFAPIRAYFASYTMCSQYLRDELPKELLQDAQTDLKLDHVRALIGQRPKGFKCLVKNMISVNTAGQIELCCCVDNKVENYNWGSVESLTDYKGWKELREKMLLCNTCRECQNLGIDYWTFNNPIL